MLDALLLPSLNTKCRLSLVSVYREDDAYSRLCHMHV